MILTCERTDLVDALSLCLHAIPSKSIIPTLEGVLFNVNKDRVKICGYNTQLCIQKTIPAISDDMDSVVLPARMLYEIVRKTQADTVTFDFDKELNVVITCGRSVFHVKAESGNDYPEMPAVAMQNSLTIPSNLLRQMINDTMYAISTNENKPIHTGTLFETEDNVLSLISVDGFRLAVRKEEVEMSSSEPFSFVVPGATLKELARILPDNDEPVVIYPEKTHGMFHICGTMVLTRLLEGDFLNYRSAVPAEMPIKLTINKSQFIEAVERVSLVITERLKNPVRCLFEGESLKLSCITGIGAAYEEMSIDYCPEKMEIGFNCRYIIDALKSCPDDIVTMELKTSLSPCLFRPLEGDKFLYLVLPVRLKAEE